MSYWLDGLPGPMCGTFPGKPFEAAWIVRSGD